MKIKQGFRYIPLVTILTFACLRVCAFYKKTSYPSHWKPHEISATSSKTNKPYSLEIIEFKVTTEQCKNAPILLLIPGYFQNAYSWDLLPNKNISVVNFIKNHSCFHTFSLHPNGIGNSDYVRLSNIDDVAIDDISHAINYLKENFKKNIFVLGHSKGAITLQAYLSGLTRSKNGNYFDKKVAIKRQQKVEAFGLSAGNVCMSDNDQKTQIDTLSRIGTRIQFLNNRLGWINAKILTRIISPAHGPFSRLSAAYFRVWEFLYHIENTSKEARAALYELTIEGTSSPTLTQFSKGVLNGCIRNTSGEKYNEGLKNIKIPAFQMTYSLDPMAVPEFTKRDDFDYIGSKDKDFISFTNQGHEDFMMNPKFHENLNWLLNHFEKYK